MKILIVGNSKKNNTFAAFVREQARALQEAGAEVEMFGVTGKGLTGYLRCLPALKQKIREFRPDIIHAHYGLSGLLANLQRNVPVVTTYHGSDINERAVRVLSRLAMMLSGWNIFVSRRTMQLAHPHHHYTLLPCGIDLDELQLISRSEARKRMNLDANGVYILFAGAFDNRVKNFPLAEDSVTGYRLLVTGEGTGGSQNNECNECLTTSNASAEQGAARLNNLKLLELKGYNREEVTMLMCACDAFLLTSISEGSPQVIKEAMACGCKIVSVDVGDVSERLNGLEGCYVANTREPEELAELLRKAVEYPERTKGRERIIADGLDNRLVAKRLMEIYAGVLERG